MEKYFCSYSQEHTIPGDFTEGPKEAPRVQRSGRSFNGPLRKTKSYSGLCQNWVVHCKTIRWLSSIDERSLTQSRLQFKGWF